MKISFSSSSLSSNFAFSDSRLQFCVSLKKIIWLSTSCLRSWSPGWLSLITSSGFSGVSSWGSIGVLMSWWVMNLNKISFKSKLLIPKSSSIRRYAAFPFERSASPGRSCFGFWPSSRMSSLLGRLFFLVFLNLYEKVRFCLANGALW